MKIVTFALLSLTLSACAEPVPAVGFAGDACSTLEAACAGGSAVVTCEGGVYVEAFKCAQELCAEESYNDPPRVCCENEEGEYACIGTADKDYRCVGDAECNPLTE